LIIFEDFQGVISSKKHSWGEWKPEKTSILFQNPVNLGVSGFLENKERTSIFWTTKGTIFQRIKSIFSIFQRVKPTH